MLDATECIGEVGLGLFQAPNIAAQQEMGGGVESESEEHVHHVHLTFAQLDHQFLHVLLEDVNVTQPVLDELRPDELTRVVPYLSVSVEDA